MVFRLSSFSVVDFAISRGMDHVNKDTTSKEVMVSSGLIFTFSMCERKVLTLLIEWVEDFLRVLGCQKGVGEVVG